MATRDDILRTARAELGYRETPVNRTKYGRWYGMDGQPWCDMFVSWVAWKNQATNIVGKFAYTPTHADWFRSRGRYYPGTKGIKRGHIVFFRFSGARIHHVGIVESVRANGDLVCIEGNTSTANQRDGGGVMRRVRNPKYVVGHGRPAYKPLSKAKFTLTRLLRLSSPMLRGTDVVALQKALKITADGIFGRQTEAAVKQYQKANGLKADGIVGKATAEKLGWSYR